jgi:hypothetical protein
MEKASDERFAGTGDEKRRRTKDDDKDDRGMTVESLG